MTHSAGSSSGGVVFLRPTWLGTALLLAGAGGALLLARGETAAELARGYAIGVGLGLFASLLADLRPGVRNLVRADVLCLLALYGLTLLEFLFPQPDFARLQTAESVRQALILVALGVVGLGLGRHLVPPRALGWQWLGEHDTSPRLLLVGLGLAWSLGFLHVALAVGFNPVRYFEATMGPRFGVPWQRGRFGGFRELVHELGLLLHLVPGFAAAIWHCRRRVAWPWLLFTAALLALTLWHGFTSGTRNLLATYLAVLLGAYLLLHPRPRLLPVATAAAVVAGLFGFLSYHMLEFRNMGLAKYVQEGAYTAEGGARQTLFVDYNLHAIAEITDAFPEDHPYLGGEVITWAVVRPVPRALWPAKPEGLSYSIEQVTGAKTMTVASTFVGEAYMGFGVWGVVLAGLFFGAVAAWWNRLGAVGENTLGVLIFAAGLLAFAIAMRSLFWFSTGALPAVALLAVAWLWGRRKRERTSAVPDLSRP